MNQVYEQMEMADITDPIDDAESFYRHKQAMAMRYFKMWKMEKEEKKRDKILKYYNYMAQEHSR